jgi:hypothetical protein
MYGGVIRVGGIVEEALDRVNNTGLVFVKYSIPMNLNTQNCG